MRGAAKVAVCLRAAAGDVENARLDVGRRRNVAARAFAEHAHLAQHRCERFQVAVDVRAHFRVERDGAAQAGALGPQRVAQAADALEQLAIAQPPLVGVDDFLLQGGGARGVQQLLDQQALHMRHLFDQLRIYDPAIQMFLHQPF